MATLFFVGCALLEFYLVLKSRRRSCICSQFELSKWDQYGIGRWSLWIEFCEPNGWNKSHLGANARWWSPAHLVAGARSEFVSKETQIPLCGQPRWFSPLVSTSNCCFWVLVALFCFFSKQVKTNSELGTSELLLPTNYGSRTGSLRHHTKLLWSRS